MYFYEVDFCELELDEFKLRQIERQTEHYGAIDID